MKIAVTADVHLGTKSDHPERFNALENIIEQLESEKVTALIIAGDLFDKDFRNYSDFEELSRKHSGIEMHMIPGNHDPGISSKNIVGENIHIYDRPTVVEFDSRPFLFLPFETKVNMGEKIAEKEDEIAGKEWILVAHGDYYGGVKEPNPYEPGTYMPLSRKDVERFKPRNVFLGHIHKPFSRDGFHYTGSPCGLDINETGKRRFLLYDTTGGEVISRFVETDVLYFRELFVVVPTENEVSILEEEIRKRIDSWDIDGPDYPKVRLRVEAAGYASDRSAILTTLENGFEGFRFYKDEGVKIDRLSASSDHQRNAIADRVRRLVDELDWDFGGDEPTREDVLIKAMSVIYGE